MPIQKDFKRVVRQRMQKTGESYTAARAQLLKTNSAKTRPTVQVRASAKVSPAAKSDYAKLAGMSDVAVKAATGCTWEKWVKALDHAKAYEWPHRKITDYVLEKYKTPDWWTQMVVVGYERIRGLREIGQRRGGGYEANKSRTFAAPAAKLYEAFATTRMRAKWLTGIKLQVRKTTPHRSVRMTLADGTPVEVWIVSKGAGKSSAQVQHRKLPDKESATRSKAFWSERLDALGEVLTG